MIKEKTNDTGDTIKIKTKDNFFWLAQSKKRKHSHKK